MNKKLSQGCEDCFRLSAFSPAKAKAPHGEVKRGTSLPNFRKKQKGNTSLFLQNLPEQK